MDKISSSIFLMYAGAAVIFLYILAGLLWMFIDLFRGKHTVYFPESIPKAGKSTWITWIWKSLFVLLIITGFIICIYYFVHEQVAMALLIPVPFFLLARAFSSKSINFQKKSSKHLEIIILVLFILAAAFVRCYRISDYPPGLASDEISIARDVNLMLRGLTVRPYFGRTGTFRIIYAPLALFHKFLPRCHATIRSYWILCGILSIPAFYCLARKCLPLFLAMLVTVLLIFSPYHNFYSRVLTGAEVTIFEIISLYFLITAMNRKSYSRIAFSSVGVGLMQYNYFAVRLMPLILLLGIFMAWLGGRVKPARMFLCIAVATVITLIVLIPYYCIPKPEIYNLFPLGDAKMISLLKSQDEVKIGIRNCFLMFGNEKYAVSRFITQSTAQVLDLPLLALLIGGLLFSFTMFGIWPAFFIGLCFFIFLLPSCVSSTLGNSHRAILVIPIMYLLMGYGLWMLAIVLRSLTGRVMTYLVLGIIVAWSSIWGVKYFFVDMWDIPREALESSRRWRTSEVRVTDASWELAKDNYQIFTSTPWKYYAYLYDNESISLPGLTFRAKDWLPENWDHSKRAVVLSEVHYGPVFNIMTQWAWPYSWEEKFYPIGRAKLLIGRFDGHERKFLAPKMTMRLEELDQYKQWDGSLMNRWLFMNMIYFALQQYEQWDGSLMLARQYEIVLKDHTDGAEIYIDGEPMFPVGKSAVFAAGLHDVRILSPDVWKGKTRFREPFFDFEIRDPTAKSHSKIRITPSILYSIPVHGWVHKAHPLGEPSKIESFAIEPFIYSYEVLLGKRYPKKIVHEWKSQVQLASGDTLPLRLYFPGSDTEVYVDGKKVGKHLGRNSMDFQLKGSEKDQTVLIRCVVPRPADILRILLTKQGEQESPPYELFWPLPGDRFRPTD